MASTMTTAQWQSALDACGGDISQETILKLIYDKGPNALWTKQAMKLMDYQPFSTYRYFKSFFPTREWADWQGVKEMGQQYHAAYVPFNLRIFQRAMQICDPSSLNECHTDYCDIPKGGISSLPEMEMWKTGFKTQPMCIANIRTSQAVKDMAQNIINERFNVDQQVMEMFMVMATIRMLGHKWVLEGSTNSDGTIDPVASTNPYNMLGGHRYNFMNPLFPQIGNINNVLPLDFFTLDSLGRALTTSRNPNSIATGPRGTPIFELWHGEDWYRTEVMDNPEWIDKMKFYMNNNLIPGYTMDSGEREVVGNFSFKQMPGLPRYAESTEGGLTIIQQGNEVAVESGNRTLHNWREWDNAPFITTVMLGKGVGSIIHRPAITTGIEGRPILPITGDGDWVYRNDYDKECNEDLNMPHFRKRFEMGFKMENPDAGWGFISRAKKFRIRPINTCNLRPLFTIAPSDSDCSIVTVGCNPLNEKHNNNFSEEAASASRKILCQSVLCGGVAGKIYRVKIRRESVDSYSVGQGPFACGDTVVVGINDASNTFKAVQSDATILDYLPPNVVNPDPVYLIQLGSAILATDCIGFILKEDATPGVGNVVSCLDTTNDDSIAANTIKVLLDSKLAVTLTSDDDVLITWKDVDGATLGTRHAKATVVNHATFAYTLLVDSPSTTLSCTEFEDAATITVEAE